VVVYLQPIMFFQGIVSCINSQFNRFITILKFQAAEISAYHEYQTNPTSHRQSLSSIVDHVITEFLKFDPLSHASNEEDGSDDEREFLDRFDFHQSPCDASTVGGGGDGNSLEMRLRSIERPKSFEVKRSFTDEVFVVVYFL